MPHLCGFEKWTLGMNRTGWVSRSVSGLRNVISFPLKPESKQPFRPAMGSPVHLSSDGTFRGSHVQRRGSSCPRSPKRYVRRKMGLCRTGSPGLGQGCSPWECSAPCQGPRTIQEGLLVLIKGFESPCRRPGKDWTDKLVLSGADFIRLGDTQGQISWKLTDSMDFNTLWLG